MKWDQHLINTQGIEMFNTKIFWRKSTMDEDSRKFKKKEN